MRRVEGSYDPAFRAVAAAFVESFAAGQHRGAALSLVVEGRVVADIWGGTADSEGVRPWHRDTVVNVFSATKGITALCAHLLAARGALDLDAPVSGLWPEFRAAGKGAITVAQLLDHSAGLPAIREWLPAGTLFD